MCAKFFYDIFGFTSIIPCIKTLVLYQFWIPLDQWLSNFHNNLYLIRSSSWGFLYNILCHSFKISLIHFMWSSTTKFQISSTLMSSSVRSLSSLCYFHANQSVFHWSQCSQCAFVTSFVINILLKRVKCGQSISEACVHLVTFPLTTT